MCCAHQIHILRLPVRALPPEEASSALLLQLAELDRHDAQQRMEDELPRQEAALQARERLLREIDAGIRIPTHRSSYT